MTSHLGTVTRTLLVQCLLAWPAAAPPLDAQTTLRIMPPDGAVIAVGQRFDLRVEATAADTSAAPPRGLLVSVDGQDVTGRNILDPGVGGEPGAGGTGSTRPEVPARQRAGKAPAHTTNFLVRAQHFDEPGTYTIQARTDDGAEASVTVHVEAWEAPGGAPVRNVILLLGDGMGLADRTAARIVARGVTAGRANGLLAMDRMEATGLVMTYSLNSVITDSAPGMSAIATGHKCNNDQMGVYPDNTLGDPFDNPRVEYIGELLRRERGEGFRVGLVTTADITDASPAANAVHTADRNVLPLIAGRYLDERETNGVAVLLGGGSRHFTPTNDERGATGRDLVSEFRDAGYRHLTTATEVRDLLAAEQVPDRLLGLFHASHMNVAFDKVGAGRYSDELVGEGKEALRDQPLLPDMTRLALRALEDAPAGFYLLVEGASIDKQAHAADAERTIWDVIEFDQAVGVALAFAERTNTDDDPDNGTLVLVATDHETGGLAVVGVGNERYAPGTTGRAVRDYAAVFRFQTEQVLNFFPNYESGATGFPVDPDPTRKLLLGWAASPDRYENWLSNRRALPQAVYGRRPDAPPEAPRARAIMAVANAGRDGPGPDSDNRGVDGRPVPGFLVEGVIENGAAGCPAPDGCPADTGASAQTVSGHTASDVPISASGPGAFLFTGTFDNTQIFLRMLRAAGGSYERSRSAGR